MALMFSERGEDATGRRRGARAAAGSHDNAAIDVMRTRSSAPLFTHLTIPLR